VRPLILRHPAGARRPLDRVFNRGPYPWGGDTNTVNQAAVNPADPASTVLVIASLRMAVDVGHWDASRYVLPGGQSGNPLSPHYDDQLALFLRGEGVPIAWSEEAIEAAAREVLRLEPEESG
jgi:penicillin amidase